MGGTEDGAYIMVRKHTPRGRDVSHGVIVNVGGVHQRLWRGALLHGLWFTSGGKHWTGR